MRQWKMPSRDELVASTILFSIFLAILVGTVLPFVEPMEKALSLLGLFLGLWCLFVVSKFQTAVEAAVLIIILAVSCVGLLKRFGHG